MHDHDDRSRHREVHGIDAEGNVAIRRQIVRAGLLPEAAVVLGWHRGLCIVASLVA